MIARIRSYLMTSKKLLAAILVLGLATSVFAVGLMFVAGYLISASADNVYSILMLNIPLAFVQLFGLGRPIAQYFERLKSHDWVLRLTSKLRYRLFCSVQKSYQRNHRFRTGEVLASLASDIEQVQDLYLRTVFPVLIAWLTGVLLVVIAGVVSLPLFLFALGMLVLLCAVVPFLALVHARVRIRSVNDQRVELHASVTDAVLGAQDVAISGRGQDETQRLLSGFEHVDRDTHRIERNDRIRLIFIQVLLLVVLIVLVWWSAQYFGGVSGGSANWIIAIALGFFPLIELFAPLSQQFEDGLSHSESLKRLDEQGALHAADKTSCDTPKPHGPLTIVCDHLSYAHDSSCVILNDIVLTIPFGQKVAILGKSGAGKTTLAHLIHGDFEPTGGSVRIADVSAGNLKGVMWDYVGLISQNSYIFAMSIMDNLRIGKIDVTETEAWEALRAVGLETYVKSLPDGLETMADEAGLRFSGGQRQRLALARVLLQDPPIVILDEPTVGLDPLTEQVILDTIAQVLVGKTVLAITHHLQGVELFDRVLFLEQGDLVMDGTPEQLARENERYRSLLAFDRGAFA